MSFENGAMFGGVESGRKLMVLILRNVDHRIWQISYTGIMSVDHRQQLSQSI